MKALIPKMQDPLKPRKQLTTKQFIAFCVFLTLGVLAIWFFSYYGSTGLYPFSFLNRPEIVLPPEMHPEEQTYKQVFDFIQSDDTETIPYGDGFNCVDATFRIWRNAYWEGIAAYPIVIEYNESPGHMVIVFPTSDRGDIIIEPQGDLQIRPRVGQDYDGRQVKGIYVFDCDFLPLDDSPPYDFDMNTE
jgi:hypothetical protein